MRSTTHAKTNDWSTRCCLLLACLLMLCGSTSRAQIFNIDFNDILQQPTFSITGRVVYGPVDDTIGEIADPDRYLQQGDPITHVWVQLNDGAGIRRGWDITDADGNFSIEVTGTPDLTLVTKARNDYAKVYKFKGTLQNLPTDKVIRTKLDVSGLIDWSDCPGDGCDIGTVTVTDDAVDTFDTINGTQLNYESRGLYLASAAHQTAQHIESIHGEIPGGHVNVRYGMENSATAWFWQGGNTIYLPTDDPIVFHHEYGHLLEKRLGIFSLIPSYTFSGHGQCTEIFDWLSPNEPNVCWAWFEGLAEWFGAVGASSMFGGYDGQIDALSHCDDWDPNCESGYYDVENTLCVASQFDEPGAVESLISAVLWDLIDSEQDPDNGSGIDEVADVTESKLMQILTTDIGSHSTCTGFDKNSVPIGLEEFCETWKAEHTAPYPHLYAAYAFNGVDIGPCEDQSAPDPLTVESNSHQVGIWSNNPSVKLSITDGGDDMSGSYHYYFEFDLVEDRDVDTNRESDFRSAAALNSYTMTLPEGEDQYVHANSLDMAGHEGTETSHFGPLKIDLTDGYFLRTGVEAKDKTMVLGYNTNLRWISTDDLSGARSVEIEWESTSGGVTSIASDLPPIGQYTWRVDTPHVGPGVVRFKTYDRAGNEGVEEVEATVVPPFEGSLFNIDLEDGRVIAADLNLDADDELILSAQINPGAGEIYVFGGTGGGGSFAISQTISRQPAEDLCAADIDRDGDIDVVTVGKPLPGGLTEMEFLLNAGNGILVDPGIVVPMGQLHNQTVRVVTAPDGGAPIIVVFGDRPATGPDIMAWTYPALVPTSLTGLDPIDGDWETGDLNADSYLDFVALGSDGGGNANLTVFWGGPSGWARDDLRGYGSIDAGDVDVADFDANGLLDLFVMFEEGGATRITELLQQDPTGFTTYASATSSTQQLAEGDGKIVDYENDAWGEVVAMGNDIAGSIESWSVRNRVGLGSMQTDAPLDIIPLSDSDTAWGDFDGDGDIEPFYAGHNALGFWMGSYSSNIGDYVEFNDAPEPPANLTSVYDSTRGGYLFSWDAPTADSDETPKQGLTYEIRIGTSPGSGTILSWLFEAGQSKQGAATQRFVRMPRGIFHADVRTVDSAGKRSLGWSSHQTTP